MRMLSGKKILIVIAAVLLVLAIVVVLVVKTLFSTVGPVTLTYWGLWEPNAVYQSVIEDYKRVHPNVTINYQKVSPVNYRERLMSAMAGEGGPDIVRIHNTWLPMMKNYLQPLPSTVYSASSFKDTFYPVASSDLTSGGAVWAVPLEIDTLVMYVNNDLLTASGVSVPTTWEDFSPAATKIRVPQSGKINTAGAALGSATNVDHWQDIVGLMMAQAGVDMNGQPNSKAASEVLGFYTGFETASQVWDETLDASTLAFASGKVGFYFAPSWRYFDIKNINANLNFKVAPVPQLSGGKVVNYASYWAEGVSKKSKNAAQAADFLKFISSKEEMTKLYAAEQKLRGFGEPYSRVDLGPSLSSDPVAGVVIAQAPSAQSWYLASATNDGDTGINTRISKYYLDAINAVLNSGDVGKTLDTVATGVSQVLGEYGIVTRTSASQ